MSSRSGKVPSRAAIHALPLRLPLCELILTYATGSKVRQPQQRRQNS